jgi:hypothetical protein
MGGNVFANAKPFDHKDASAILKTINQVLADSGIHAIPVGSAATPVAGKISNDMDVVVDEKAVINFFKVKDAKTARKALRDYIANKGLATSQSGINVHVSVPVRGNNHQVDIMVTPNAERVSKFHTHNIPTGSPYKGVNKQLIIAILAKSKGYLWSAWQGLFLRDENGKKSLDTIAKTIVGNHASAKDLSSTESVLAALPKDEAKELLSKAKEDANWVELPTQESTELARIKQLSGL